MRSTHERRHYLVEPNTEESICLTSHYLTVFYTNSIEIGKMFINTIPPALRCLVGHSHEILVDSPGFTWEIEYGRKKISFESFVNDPFCVEIKM